MERDEAILDELINFEQKKPRKIPPILDDYLKEIAKTGEVIFPWNKIRPLFAHKLQQVIEDFHEQFPTEHLQQSPNVEIFKYEIMKEKLVEATLSFNCPPFTIQRLCELLTAPTKHYKRTDKFMRGIEKNMLVVSCLQTPRRPTESFDHNSIILNGAVEPVAENGSPSVQLDSFVSAFTPGNERLQHSLSNHNHVFNNSNPATDNLAAHSSVPCKDESDDAPPPAKSPKLSIPLPDVQSSPGLEQESEIELPTVIVDEPSSDSLTTLTPPTSSCMIPEVGISSEADSLSPVAKPESSDVDRESTEVVESKSEETAPPCPDTTENADNVENINVGESSDAGENIDIVDDVATVEDSRYEAGDSKADEPVDEPVEQPESLEKESQEGEKFQEVVEETPISLPKAADSPPSEDSETHEDMPAAISSSES